MSGLVELVSQPSFATKPSKTIRLLLVHVQPTSKSQTSTCYTQLLSYLHHHLTNFYKQTNNIQFSTTTSPTLLFPSPPTHHRRTKQNRRRNQNLTAGDFSTLSIGTLCPTRLRMLLIPYLQHPFPFPTVSRHTMECAASGSGP